jgi:cation diffusion facilitator CzcD-associated flavoprotein CzcO
MPERRAQEAIDGADDALAALAARVAADLARIAHPRAPWLEPWLGPDGRPALDVLIVGAGQSGAAVAFGLRRARVDNILLIDKAVRGREGPWLTYARMPMLRSPKDYTGPDLDIPNLTYQSWHEAKYGAESWAAVAGIPRELWAEYLLWVRDVTGAPVRNGAELVDMHPSGRLLAATVRTADGAYEVLYARKILLATGQEGTGGWCLPDVIAALPPRLRTHCAEPIDFASLRGKTVAVVGAGASALDNAAAALESGASEVIVLCRRTHVQLVQPYRWLTFRGFLNHLGDLDDAWRWRFMSHVLGLREGFPQDTYDRCARHDGFRLLTGAAVQDARVSAGRVAIALPQGVLAADFVICAAGIEMDFAARPELRRLAANIATWGDRYLPPEAERNARLARYPYLAPDFSLIEKVAGKTPWMQNVHLFAIGATMSFGPSGSSINAMTTAVPKAVSGLTRGLFAADVERHWAALRAYAVPQAVVAAANPTAHALFPPHDD